MQRRVAVRFDDLAQPGALPGIPELDRAVGARRQHALPVAGISDGANLPVLVGTSHEFCVRVVQLGAGSVQGENMPLTGFSDVGRRVDGPPESPRIFWTGGFEYLARAGLEIVL